MGLIEERSFRLMLEYGMLGCFALLERIVALLLVCFHSGHAWRIWALWQQVANWFSLYRHHLLSHRLSPSITIDRFLFRRRANRRWYRRCWAARNELIQISGWRIRSSVIYIRVERWCLRLFYLQSCFRLLNSASGVITLRVLSLCDHIYEGRCLLQ